MPLLCSRSCELKTQGNNLKHGSVVYISLYFPYLKKISLSDICNLFQLTAYFPDWKVQICKNDKKANKSDLQEFDMERQTSKTFKKYKRNKKKTEFYKIYYVVVM